MAKVISVSKKNQNFPLFLTKTGQKKNWHKVSQHPAQMNVATSNIAKTLAFSSFPYRQEPKIYLCHLEKKRK